MDTSADLGFNHQPELPVAISLIGGRYLLFDIKIATYLRREHNLCGVTLGTLPLSPAQNLFLGVPIEIMPEEVQLLVDKDVGFIVDDAREHDQVIHSVDTARRADYLARLQKQSKQVEHLKDHEKKLSRKAALLKQARRSGESSVSDKTHADLLDFVDDGGSTVTHSESTLLNETLLHDSESPVKVLPNTITSNSYQVTPATSRLLLPPPPTIPKVPIHDLPASYPLYKHLHERGFFMSPGLRFGCQYAVYPGDPLRFHSHFLAVGSQWDEEIDLMDLVGGGRLGTGVKKGFLLGGASPAGDVRTFSIEWAAM